MKRKIGKLCLFILLFNIIANQFQMPISAAIKNEIISIEDNNKQEKNEESLDIIDDSIEILLGSIKEIEVAYESEKYKKEQLIWSSSNEEIIKVSGNQLYGVSEGEAIITVQNPDMSISDQLKVKVVRNFNKDIETMSYEDNELLNKYNAYSGVSYEITNTTNEYIYVYPSGIFDVICYNNNSTIKYVRRYERAYFYLNPGEKVKIGVHNNKGSGSIYLEKKYSNLIKIVTTPVLEAFIFNKGDKFEISFNSEQYETINVLSDDGSGDTLYNYIRYENNNNVRYDINDWGTFWINNNERIRIDVITGGNTFYIPYDYRDRIKVQKVNIPVFEKFTFKEGDKFEVTLNKKDEYNMFVVAENNSSLYDFIKFGSDTELFYARQAYGDFLLSDKQKIRIDLRKGENSFYIPYDYKENFQVKKVDIPVFEEFVFKKGEKFEVSLDIEDDISIWLKMVEFGKRYDCIVYKNNELIYSENLMDREIAIHTNERIKIDLIEGGNTFYIPYDYKDNMIIKKVNTPVFNKKILIKGEVYTLKNDTLIENKILVNSTRNNNIRYDIAYYDSDFNFMGKYTNGYDDIYVRPGESIAVNVSNSSSSSIEMCIPYELEAGSEDVFIDSVKIKDTVGWYDILNNELRVTKKSDKLRNIITEVNWGENQKGQVLLKQENKTITSANGEFNIVLGEVFDVNKDIFVVAKTDSGKYSRAKKLNLKIVDSNASITFEKFSFDDYKIGSTSSDTPIISAVDFAMKLSDLPFTSEVDEEKGTIKFILGVELDEDIDFEDAYKEKKQDYRITKNSIKPVKYSLNEDWGWKDTEVTGYIECIESNGRLIVIAGGIGVNSGGSLNFGSQLWAGPVPIYIQLGIGMDLGFAADILKGGNINNGKLDLVGNVTLTPNISPEGGIGINEVLSVGLRGNLALNSTINLYPVDAKFSLTGGIGIIATAMSFEYELPLVSGEWAISGKPMNSNLLNNEEEYNLYNVNNYKIMDRSYVNNTSEWNLSEISTFSNISSKSNESMEILQSGVLPTTEPIIANSNNKKIIIYIRDNESRSSINRTELVYSIYNEETNSWDEPKAIYNDNTADFYPSVAYDESNLFVVWQNVKSIMNDNATIVDIAKNSEILVSKFDINNNKFSEVKTLTDNNTLDSMPSIATSNGKAYVTWINNSDNDIFGVKGTNKLMSVSFDGSNWSLEKTLVNEVKSIESIDMAYNGDEVNIVYSMDTDNDLNTIKDKELYYINSNEGKVNKITTNSVIDSNPKLVKNNEGLGIIWYSDGKIMYSKSVSKLVANNLFEGSQYSGRDNFNIIQKNDNLMILWTKNVDESIEVYGAIYDNESKKMGNEIRLTNIENRIKNVSTIFDNEDNIILASNVATKIEKNVDGFIYYDDGDSNLCIIKIKPAQDIRVNEESVSVDDSEFLVNKEIPVAFNIENIGQKSINSVKVELLSGNLKSGFEVNSSEVFEVNLKSGDNTWIKTNFIPKEAKNYDVQIKVTPLSGEDVFMKDNISTFNVGYEDIAIKRIYNSKVINNTILNVSISNVSSIVTDRVTLNVKEDSKDGQIIYTKTISGLSNLNEYIESIDIDTQSINFNENGEKVLFVEVIGSSNEKNIYNNSSSIIITRDYLYGDVNKDDKVDILDIALIAERYNYSVEDNEKWDYFYDINLDGVIDIFDIITLSRNIQ